MGKLFSASLILILFFIPAQPAGAGSPADRIFMKNGDRLTGIIERMEREVLTVKTEYSTEKIILEWKDVECIESERELPVLFKNNEILVGRILCPAAGKVRVASGLGLSREIPIEEIESVNPATYRGYFNAGGSLATGNTDTAAANLSTRFEVRTARHRFTVEGKINYAETEGVESARNSLGSLKYDFFSTRQRYNYAQILTERDKFANLNLRLTQGLGMGFQFFDTRKLRLFAEAGISYYNEDLEVGEDKTGASGRWAVGLEYEPFPNRLQIYHRHEGYYTPESSSFYVRAEQGFRIPLKNGFGIYIETDYRYNSRPEAGKKSSDALFVGGISYEYAYW